MLLINDRNIRDTGINWGKTVGVIQDAVLCLAAHDFAQPVKPYLRYRDPKNRIIAMPAFVGGDINMAGIKWIASFPDNIKKGIPRAHSVVVLNNADTGEPIGIISTALLSIIRTASVSGLVIRHFESARKPAGIRIGIIGFGPIGQYHLKMCFFLLGDKIARVSVYDIRPVSREAFKGEEHRVEVVTSWQEAYLDSDIVITCTVSDRPYIDRMPRAGSLHLNVSLRDYTTETYPYFKNAILVDDWEEVCREKTDIERMHLENGLQKENTRSIVDIVCHHCLEEYTPETPILFNPMGMAVFDIAMGNYYYQAEKNKQAVLAPAGV